LHVQAFPAGLKMLSGDPTRRTKRWPAGLGTQAELAERAAQWTCLRAGTAGYGDSGAGFPTTDCEIGFQSRLYSASRHVRGRWFADDP
jgi:hypothetical protein